MSNLVAFGCSLTKDNYMKTWPDYLAAKMKLECVNLAARGSGLDFLSKRLLSYDFNNHDVVAIMLPSADRFDWYVDSDHPLQSDAIEIASWQDGKSAGLINIIGESNSNSGYCLSGGEHRGYKKYWFKYFYTETKAELDYWSTVLFLQKYLESENLKYFFTSVYNKDNLVEQDNNKAQFVDKTVEKIKNKVDFSKFIYYNTDKGFFYFVDENNFERLPANNSRQKKLLYPVTEAHEKFADFLYRKLKNTSMVSKKKQL